MPGPRQVLSPSKKWQHPTANLLAAPPAVPTVKEQSQSLSGIHLSNAAPSKGELPLRYSLTSQQWPRFFPSSVSPNQIIHLSDAASSKGELPLRYSLTSQQWPRFFTSLVSPNQIIEDGRKNVLAEGPGSSRQVSHQWQCTWGP